MRIWFLILGVVLSGCAEMETLSPGRGVDREVGPMANVFPSGEESRLDRHGLWRGVKEDTVVWEVRYVRGLPTGPYREWNAQGELVATWPYNWEGEIEGWIRWFDQGQPVAKMELKKGVGQPDFDPIGDSQKLLRWSQPLRASQEPLSE